MTDDDDAVLCVVDTDGRQDVNVALIRPSFQVSTWIDYLNVPYAANYANDGNRDPSLYTGRCVHTDLETNPWWTTNPWWAVDLLVQLYNRLSHIHQQR